MSAVDKARALLAKAAPGPWVKGSSPQAGEIFFGTLTDPDDPREPGVLLGSVGTDSDAELIAAAPTLLAALADEVEQLRAQPAELGSRPFDLRSPAVTTFIQWKGTQACFDFHCPACGGGGHFDGYFAYNVRCPDCSKVWEMPSCLTVREQTDPNPGGVVDVDDSPSQDEL